MKPQIRKVMPPHPGASITVKQAMAAFKIDKINGIIRDCRLAVHDISSTQLDSVNRLPRFNMPF